MKVLIQKCLKASVTVKEENYHEEIEEGYVIFVGFKNGDTLSKIQHLAKKVVNLRIFLDGKQNIQQIHGQILSISQFTLYANTKKGNRPSFSEALNSKDAKLLYEMWNQELKKYLSDIKCGMFQSHMVINIENDGPTTILLEE